TDQGGDARWLANFPVYSFEKTRHWIEVTPIAREIAASDGAPRVATSAGQAAATQRVGPSQVVQLPPEYRDDALAKAVAESWGDQLGVSVLTPESHFFALGGTSLVAVRLLSKLQRRLQLGRRLLPEALLRTPSFGPFVEHLRSGG